MYKVPYKIIFSNLLIIMCLIGSEAFALTSQNRPDRDYSQTRFQNEIVKTHTVSRSRISPQLAKGELRSRSDVMNEVKKRYDAKVLKISLNSHTGIYHVRILLPNGKVRSVQISRKR